jgi:hypothetical protein
MQNDLIESIKLGVYDKCFLKTSEIRIKNNGYTQNELKLSIFISDEQDINEYWTIDFIGVAEYHNLMGINYMPFFKIDLEVEHPLLWDYLFDTVECELSGVAGLNSDSLNALTGALARCYYENTYGFIKIESNPLLSQLKRTNGNLFFSTNEKIIEITESIFNQYNIHLLEKQIRRDSQKGWYFRPNAKVLLFRNPFVTSATNASGQTYIVADEIRINKLNES